MFKIEGLMRGEKEGKVFGEGRRKESKNKSNFQRPTADFNLVHPARNSMTTF